MRFATFLAEGYTPPTPQPVDTPNTTTKTIISTSFYDAQRQLQQIQVEANVTRNGHQVSNIRPLRVKFHNRLIPYEKFLQAIPNQRNQALFDPDHNLDVWSTWVV